MSIFRHSLAVLLLIGFCYSCEKNTSSNGSTPNLARMVSQFGDTIGYTNFFYDSQDRLEATADSNNNGESQRMYISYNSKNFPIKFRSVIKQSLNHPDLEYIDSLIYNNNSKIVKRFTKFSSNSYVLSNTYSYDNLGRLTTDSMFGLVRDVFGYTNFNYDNNDNIIQSQYFLKREDGILDIGPVVSYSYNTDLSPYQNFSLTAYYLKRGIYPSKHNVVREDYGNGRYKDYIYEYDSNNLLKKININSFPNSMFSKGTVEFYYD